MTEKHDACAECGEPMARDYQTPVLCQHCWNLTPIDDRGPYVKANRNDEQSVIAAKRNREKS